jgi:hypothetical protein
MGQASSSSCGESTGQADRRYGAHVRPHCSLTQRTSLRADRRRRPQPLYVNDDARVPIDLAVPGRRGTENAAPASPAIRVRRRSPRMRRRASPRRTPPPRGCAARGAAVDRTGSNRDRAGRTPRMDSHGHGVECLARSCSRRKLAGVLGVTRDGGRPLGARLGDLSVSRDSRDRSCWRFAQRNRSFDQVPRGAPEEDYSALVCRSPGSALRRAASHWRLQIAVDDLAFVRGLASCRDLATDLERCGC